MISYSQASFFSKLSLIAAMNPAEVTALGSMPSMRFTRSLVTMPALSTSKQASSSLSAKLISAGNWSF